MAFWPLSCFSIMCKLLNHLHKSSFMLSWTKRKRKLRRMFHFIKMWIISPFIISYFCWIWRYKRNGCWILYRVLHLKRFYRFFIDIMTNLWWTHISFRCNPLKTSALGMQFNTELQICGMAILDITKKTSNNPSF